MSSDQQQQRVHQPTDAAHAADAGDAAGTPGAAPIRRASLDQSGRTAGEASGATLVPAAQVGDPAAALLEGCSREPIHIPGAVQSHGALLIVEPAGWTVVQASANAATWLGRAATELIGMPLAQVVADVRPIQAATAALVDGGASLPVAPAAGVPGRGEALQLTVHRRQGVIIIECEAADAPGGPDLTALEVLARLAGEVGEAPSALAASVAAADAVHRLSAFDRVMIYRFDQDEHGEVIAEAVTPGVERFLGHHYPASDIPRQARALFQVLPVRVIADAGQTPAALVPSAPMQIPEPLDLSRCGLRAVSPIHLEYLRNMHVGASLTAGITVEGRLWGLIACHHLVPRTMTHALRGQVRAIAALLATRIAGLQRDQRQQAQLAADRLQRDLLEGFKLDLAEDWTQALMRPERILPLVDARGATLAYRGGILTAGEVPAERNLGRILEWVRATMTGPVLAVAGLAEAMGTRILPSGNHLCGVLAVALDEERQDLLVWFRPEQIREITWGGDPTKRPGPTAPGAAAPTRLSPRTSFSAWTQQVVGRSRDWSLGDLATAEAVRSHLQQVIRRLFDIRRSFERSNHELSVFAHAAAHDLQEPLHTISGTNQLLDKHLRRLLETLQAPVPEAIENCLRLGTDAAQRGQDLVRELLAYARLENDAVEIEHVPMQDAYEEATMALQRTIAEASAEIQVAPLPPVSANRRQMIQLWQNLVGNALKYRSEAHPLIRVAAERRPGGWEFAVQDNGIGIPPEFRERIFVIFKRLHPRSRYPGTGIGLALCKKIVELHGGRIWVESEAGQGSTFRFTIADPVAHADG